MRVLNLIIKRRCLKYILKIIIMFKSRKENIEEIAVTSVVKTAF